MIYITNALISLTVNFEGSSDSRVLLQNSLDSATESKIFFYF